MRIRRLDKNGDWTFGQGVANYAINGEAIRLNVETRLKSLVDDWFLDTTQNIDWVYLLGIRNNKNLILQEIERVVLGSEGVLAIEVLQIKSIQQREAELLLKFKTVFNQTEEINLIIGVQK